MYISGDTWFPIQDVCPLGGIWQYLETLLVMTAGGESPGVMKCSLGQRAVFTTANYSAQMSVVLRLRNPGVSDKLHLVLSTQEGVN